MKILWFSRISLHELAAPSEGAMNARDKMVYLVLTIKFTGSMVASYC
jgi:hypothetical protein